MENEIDHSHRPQIGIAIPAYKSVERLRRCLLSIEKISPEWLSSVVVTDDSGQGEVANALQSSFTMIKWIIHQQNIGFARSANDCVLNNDAEIVLLLNDDIELLNDPRPLLSKLFQDPSIFSVSLQSVDEFGVNREGAKRLQWRFGIAKILHNERDQHSIQNEVSESAYAVGGHAAFRKSTFVELGGFDPDFHPYYWEDVDLCERARHHGLTTLFAQKSMVLHRSDGAIKTFSHADAIRRITWRNRLKFSKRHATGINKLLFPIGLLWLRAHVALTGDRVIREATNDLLLDLQKK